MTDSLLIDGQIELIGTLQTTGQPVVSSVPGAVGAGYWLDTGYDLGAPQPTTDIVSSMLIDGERPFGRRSSNRTIALPVNITAPSRTILAGAREALLSIVNKDTWNLIWTRDGGNPLILECFRAQPSDVVYSVTAEQQFFCQLTLHFPALPFGRSDTLQQLPFASPAIGTSAPPTNVLLDSCETADVSEDPNWQLNSAHVEGSHSVLRPNETWGQFVQTCQWTRTIAATNISGRTKIQFWAGFGSYTYYRNWAYTYPGSVYFTVTLVDNLGGQLSFGQTNWVYQSSHMYTPRWTQISIPIPQNTPGFNYSNVTKLTIRASNRSDMSLWNTDFSLDAIYAVPVTTQTSGLLRGSVYRLSGILGTAHTPINLLLQRPVLNTNPDFQNTAGQGDVSSWSGFNGTLASSQGQINLYDWSALLTVTSSASAPALEGSPAPFAVTVGSAYVAGVWVYSSLTSVQIGFDWNGASGYLSTSVTTVTVVANTWTYIASGALTAPTGAVSAYVRVGFASGVAVGSTLYVQHATGVPTTATTKTMLVHIPGTDQPALFNPYMQLGSPAAPYVPNTEVTIPSLVAGQNARFNGTYTVVLIVSSWNSSASLRTVTATFREYEYPGSASTAQSTISRSLTPSTDTGTYVKLGEITLPYRDIPPDNSQWYMTVNITDTNGSDRFLDMMLIDTMGETVAIDETVAYSEYYVDAPSANSDIGRVSESQYNRLTAVSALDNVDLLSGGPLTVEPGDNQMLAWSLDGAPALTASYYPRYWIDRTME